MSGSAARKRGCHSGAHSAQRRQVGAVHGAGIAQAGRHDGDARGVVERFAVERRARRAARRPSGSFHGMPVSCTRRPGAWPTISSRALRPTRNTGLGLNGSSSSQASQARASRLTAESEIRIPLIIESHALAARRAVASRRPVRQRAPIPLRGYFSEQALIRYRVRIELEWLQALAAERGDQGAEAVLAQDRERLRRAGQGLLRDGRRAHQEHRGRDQPRRQGDRVLAEVEAGEERRGAGARSSSSTSPAPPRTSTTCPTR